VLNGAPSVAELHSFSFLLAAVLASSASLRLHWADDNIDRVYTRASSVGEDFYNSGEIFCLTSVVW
jgi:hypothetical protein